MIQHLKACRVSEWADLTHSFHPGFAQGPDPLLISIVPRSDVWCAQGATYTRSPMQDI